MNICKHISYQIIRRMHNDEIFFHRNSFLKMDVKNKYFKKMMVMIKKSSFDFFLKLLEIAFLKYEKIYEI